MNTNEIGRNIGLIDITDDEKKELNVTLESLKSVNKSFRLLDIKQIDELDRQQGFILILYYTDIDYKYNIEKMDINGTLNPVVYDLDRLLRKKFAKFRYVIILNPEEYDYGLIPFSNMYFVYANNYYNDLGIIPLIDEIYQKCINKKETKYTKKRLDNIEKLRSCIKKLRKDYFTTDEIIKKLNVNRKWLQRYMKDVNDIYNNIGYDKKKRLWYIVK